MSTEKSPTTDLDALILFGKLSDEQQEEILDFMSSLLADQQTTDCSNTINNARYGRLPVLSHSWESES